MKNLTCCIAGLVLVTIVICSPAWPQTAKLSEGMQPYVPTRFEWFELQLNASLRVNLYPDGGYVMQFIGNSTKDPIIIVVKYLPTVNREMMDMSLYGAKKIISNVVEVNGWSSWLKIKEQVEMIKLK